ncbi:MAG: thiosulfate oxidation carrier complex protein SoxZ [Pseudomonadota bacterium]
MAKIRPRVKVPRSASKGDVIEIKTLINHKMETGQRKDRKTGEKIPRKIINKFSAAFNGKTFFETDIDPAVSANPYIQFHAKVMEAGTFKFSWVDDDGTVYTTEKKIKLDG